MIIVIVCTTNRISFTYSYVLLLPIWCAFCNCRGFCAWIEMICKSVLPSLNNWVTVGNLILIAFKKFYTYINYISNSVLIWFYFIHVLIIDMVWLAFWSLSQIWNEIPLSSQSFYIYSYSLQTISILKLFIVTAGLRKCNDFFCITIM